MMSAKELAWRDALVGGRQSPLSADDRKVRIVTVDGLAMTAKLSQVKVHAGGDFLTAKWGVKSKLYITAYKPMTISRRSIASFDIE